MSDRVTGLGFRKQRTFMESLHRLSDWVSGSSPLQALFLALIGCFLVPLVGNIALMIVFWDSIAPSELEAKLSFAYTPLTAPIWLGYPVTISIQLERELGERTRVEMPHVIVCSICAMTAFFVSVTAMLVAPTKAWDGNGIQSIGAFELVVWCFGFTCSLYVIWIAARGLVLAEERYNFQSVSKIKTFCLFFVLPLGVHSIQLRLHRLIAACESDFVRPLT